MRHFILMKRKNTDKLQEIYSNLSGSPREKVMGIMMQLSVYYQMNNQSKYIEVFKNLMEVNFSFSNF
jgi:hypothetical protein